MKIFLQRNCDGYDIGLRGDSVRDKLNLIIKYVKTTLDQLEDHKELHEMAYEDNFIQAQHQLPKIEENTCLENLRNSGDFRRT